MSNEKMLTFEEWLNPGWEDMDNGFNLARQGMMPIPPMEGWDEWFVKFNGVPSSAETWQAALAWAESSGRYIRVPDVEEWPEWADFVVAYYYSNVGGILPKETLAPERVGIVTRPTPPKPVWEPKEGEVVLYRQSPKYAWIATKVGQLIESDEKVVVLLGFGVVDKSNLAPFDPAKIGEVVE